MEERIPTGGLPVAFTGTAREYFGIWIVNLLLSIVTLGVWSAWAKVRNKKYFLGNTSIDNRPFGYHATGRQILVARVIVVAFFVTYSLLSTLSPVVGFAWIFLGAFIVPWLIRRGLMFNAAMTSWSNVRFSFDGSWWSTFRVFMVYPVLAVMSLYLALPFVTRAMKRYTIGGHRFGGLSFAFDSGIGPFYVAFAVTGLWAAVGASVALASYLAFMTTGASAEVLDGSMILLAVLLVAIWIVAVFPLATIYAAFTRNAIYAGTTLEGGHRFCSKITPTTLVWIAVSNAVVVVMSLGMLLPWARIRVARYLCAHTVVIPSGSLDDFVGEARERQSALGDAYMDIDGMDVGAAV